MFRLHFPHALKDSKLPNEYRGKHCPMTGAPTGAGADCWCNPWEVLYPGTRLPCDGIHANPQCPIGQGLAIHAQFGRMLLHFLGGEKDGIGNVAGRRCPLAGIPSPVFFGDHRKLCNVFTITHPGDVLACDGVRPPEVCPLAHSNDAIVYREPNRVLVIP